MYKKFGLENLVNATAILQTASQKKYAIGQFNVNNLEWAIAILNAAKKTSSPVILGFSEGAIKYMGGYHVVVNLIVGLLTDGDYNFPIVIHLDHGSSFESCKKAIDAGFSSVMIDGSNLPINDNVKEVKQVVDYARDYEVSVEAEVGIVGGEEDGVVGEVLYAKTEDCIRIVKETGINFLAASLGSVHGHYKGTPKLGFNKMVEINSAIQVPLVLHGASGIPDDMIIKAISCGEAKINVNTECQESYCRAIKKYFAMNLDQNPKGYDPRKINKSGIEAIENTVINKINLFGTTNKA